MDVTMDANIPLTENTVEVIDCTLRDGEQSPGVWFSADEKLTLAKTLSEAGVDVLDAGFPASSGEEMEIMQTLADSDLSATLGATARPLISDIRAAYESRAKEIFMFMPTSDIRLETTLGWTRKASREKFINAAQEAAALGLKVGVVFEDATRANIQHMITLVKGLLNIMPEHIEHVILADTVGCGQPKQMETLFKQLKRACGNEVKWVPHCHNDFGLASANTLAAVEGGADAVTVTVNGIGERAGNADLSEVVAGLTHLAQKRHHVDPLKLHLLSEMVESMSGLHVNALKPVVGFNVFRHESGVHVDAMLKNTQSYEFLPSAWVGKESEYVMGKHSGTSLVQYILEQHQRSTNNDFNKHLLKRIKNEHMASSKALHRHLFNNHKRERELLLSGVNDTTVLSHYDRLSKTASKTNKTNLGLQIAQ